MIFCCHFLRGIIHFYQIPFSISSIRVVDVHPVVYGCVFELAVNVKDPMNSEEPPTAPLGDICTFSVVSGLTTLYCYIDSIILFRRL